MTSVLVVNTGSSSVKYQVISLPDERVVDHGQRDRVGVSDGKFASHREALSDILGSLIESLSIDLVGHRVVHGGQEFHEPTLITADVIEAIDALSALAPLHNPPNLEGIRAAMDVLPDVPHVAVFDTVFFASLSAAAYSYALPVELAREHGLRKYGFHGTSHQFVASELERLSERKIENRRVIIFHLGNGSSVSAVRSGVAVDTSMGFTPVAGLVMGTRSGDIDPSIPLYLQHRVGLTAEKVDELLNRHSGLLGLSGHSDMRDVFSASEAGDELAKIALDVWVWRAKHYLGAYIAQLGGVDAVVFTGGIGENQAELRRRITEGLSELGIDIEAEKNTSVEDGPRCISPSDASVEMWVIPTNEELQIARLAHAVVNSHR